MGAGRQARVRSALLVCVLGAILGVGALVAGPARGSRSVAGSSAVRGPAHVPAAAQPVAADPSAATPDAGTATPDPSAATPPTPGLGTPDAGATSAAGATPDAGATPSPTPGPVRVALVPVAGFWTAERSISRAALAEALAGRGPRPRAVYATVADLPALAAALGVRPGPNVHPSTPAGVRAAVTAHSGALGILRADDVRPQVRALAIGARALFGESRVRTLAAWPLVVDEPAGSLPSAFDPATAWTLVAGGDVMLDRGVYRQAVIQGKGADHPWNGGTAAIVARTCCGYPGFTIVRGRRTGHPGAVRDLLRRADVALVNLEGPAPANFTYHPSGFTFTMSPRLVAGLARTGVDVVSIANNHIRNGGAGGVTGTVRTLDRLGIRHAGAGRRLAAARAPAWLTVGGTSIAILAYNGAGGGAAGATLAGAAPLRLDIMRADIRAARRHGADLVIVVPHWGSEYTDRVAPGIRRLARSLVNAGADLILGSHSHWAGPLEFVNGHFVIYSMGDFVFDLIHDARTQQGVAVEATFAGSHLLQVELRPTLIVDAVQVNLLEPGRGGAALLRTIEAASRRLGR